MSTRKFNVCNLELCAATREKISFLLPLLEVVSGISERESHTIAAFRAVHIQIRVSWKSVGLVCTLFKHRNVLESAFFESENVPFTAREIAEDSTFTRNALQCCLVWKFFFRVYRYILRNRVFGAKF